MAVGLPSALTVMFLVALIVTVLLTLGFLLAFQMMFPVKFKAVFLMKLLVTFLLTSLVCAELCYCVPYHRILNSPATEAATISTPPKPKDPRLRQQQTKYEVFQSGTGNPELQIL